MTHNPQRTTSDGVATSYYGQPVIKPAHWGWLVIVYLFLGGIAGAGSAIATIANMVSPNRKVEKAARYISFAAFIPCGPLLVLDLGRPDRFLNMLRILKLKSPMSLGSWALSALGVFATLSTGLELMHDLFGRDAPLGVRRAVGIAGLPFSIFMSGYTGVLLLATNVPLWWRSSILLPMTFVASAYSTSLAVISIVLGFGRNKEAEQRLARAEIMCLTMELGLITATVVRLGKIGRPLTAGRIGAIFWPVTYVGGILVPLLLQRGATRGGKPVSKNRRFLTGMLALIGGFSLRTVMIFAGRESARRPEDYFAMTSKLRG